MGAELGSHSKVTPTTPHVQETGENSVALVASGQGPMKFSTSPASYNKQKSLH